eukprot:688302-Prymnesium_polylepis.1
MHLWRWDEHWMVTSSEGHLNADEPEYPWITSDFVGPSPCGWYQHGLARIRVAVGNLITYCDRSY